MRTLPHLAIAILALASLGQAPAVDGGVVTGRVRTFKDGKPIRVAEVWVYLEPKATSDVRVGARIEKEVIQRRTSFVPDVTVIPIGGRIYFPNRDATEHNVFSPAAKPWWGFDNGKYAKHQKGRSQPFDELGQFDIYCDMHPNMSAKVKTVPTLHYARVDKSGAYKLPGVPPGAYRVTAWTPDSRESRSQYFVVKAGTTTAVEPLNLQYRQRSCAHRRKDGTPYPVYVPGSAPRPTRCP